MNLHLTGKRALVTGSTSGIGRAIAQALTAEGATVLIHGRNPDRAKETADALNTDYVLGDLTTNAQEVINAAQGVDILVNNAAASTGDDWLAGGPETWLDLYNTNVASAVRLIAALTPHMRTQGWGRVIQISSAAHPYPLPMKAAYSATKAALSNLTVSLSKDLSGTGVTANTISPGPTLTDNFRHLAETVAQKHNTDTAAATRTLLAGPLANPSARLAEPHEIAALVTLVASPLSASINGANLRIDGGFTPTVN
ncbi:SDR family NAD(P)-dependent oxidoreductase [Actinomadura barringtoniae]|uniref:SDR family NAD(P)-dependent oxidoreductase n=1 Tax=Actinomadura barringtoniae TaxID=1427535 RepID=A0A939T321_9ACTN|nr:SDR family NAD(P)-dependent oxidoreductase [Actinomadura barringtoniae]MBO2450501.1 SDR family NAD(P)-dependent oxidoreductase [Actinomadura barringtoniae]